MESIGSLFSGIGGIEIGFENAGFKTIWFVENDPYAQKILNKQFLTAQIYGDIKNLDFKSVPKVDIITGGFPCQDISNAGNRAGIQGSRSSLWKYYLKAISEIRPKIAFIENVSALLNRGLDTVLSDLASIGYDAEWHCVPASAVGALHKRDRIYIIAYPNCNGCLNERKLQKKRCEGDAFKEIRRDYTRSRYDEQKSFNASNSMFRGYNRKQCQESLQKKNSNVENSICNGVKKRYRKKNNRGEKSQEYSNYPSKPSTGEWQSIWSTEPKLGRVVDGIPNRMDRVKCLGNAVVPQVAEVIARAIRW